MFLNYSLPAAAAFTTASTNSNSEIAPGVRIGLDPGKGVIGATAQDHLVLDLDWSVPAPDWSELAVVLAPDWRACRQIVLRYRAAAEVAEAGEAGEALTIRPALRMGHEAGFIDHFSAAAHVLDTDPADHVSEFVLPPRRLAPATWMDLHLFFGRAPGRITLHGLSLTGLR